MRHATSRHRRYSDACGGELTVHVTPTGDTDRHGKSAMQIRITSPSGLTWAPDEPLWLSPLYDPASRRGRREAADAALDFFESSGCGAARNPAAPRKYPRLSGDAARGREIIRIRSVNRVVTQRRRTAISFRDGTRKPGDLGEAGRAMA